MSAPHGKEVGAELGELYLKGKVTLAQDVASQFSEAAAALGAISVYGAMSRDGDLGTGASGPYSEFSAARWALQVKLEAMHDQLVVIGQNIMRTAQDMAAVDEETAKGFRSAGGETLA